MVGTARERLIESMMVFQGFPETDRELVGLLVDRATSDILTETNRVEVIPELESLILDLAITYWRSIDANGVKSYSEGAISITYATERDPSLGNRITNLRLTPIAKVTYRERRR